jgi:hypothetical protein
VVPGDGEPVEIEPLGDGTESVASFYDFGPPKKANTGLETSDTSQLFLYDGADGMSLGMLHDAPDGTGGAASFGLSGVPDSGSFVVRDDPDADTYSTTGADWAWNGRNTDGGVIGTFDDGFEITVDAAFNDAAAESPGKPGLITSWIATGGDRASVELPLNGSTTVRAGCSSDEVLSKVERKRALVETIRSGARDAIGSTASDLDTAGETLADDVEGAAENAGIVIDSDHCEAITRGNQAESVTAAAVSAPRSFLKRSADLGVLAGAIVTVEKLFSRLTGSIGGASSAGKLLASAIRGLSRRVTRLQRAVLDLGALPLDLRTEIVNRIERLQGELVSFVFDNPEATARVGDAIADKGIKKGTTTASQVAADGNLDQLFQDIQEAVYEKLYEIYLFQGNYETGYVPDVLSGGVAPAGVPEPVLGIDGGIEAAIDDIQQRLDDPDFDLSCEGRSERAERASAAGGRIVEYSSTIDDLLTEAQDRVNEPLRDIESVVGSLGLVAYAARQFGNGVISKISILSTIIKSVIKISKAFAPVLAAIIGSQAAFGITAAGVIVQYHGFTVQGIANADLSGG